MAFVDLNNRQISLQKIRRKPGTSIVRVMALLKGNSFQSCFVNAVIKLVEEPLKYEKNPDPAGQPPAKPCMH